VDAVDLLTEQYRTVRQESLDALTQMQTIMQWGLGSVGVSIGLGLVAAQRSATGGAVILMLVVPVLIVLGSVVIAVPARRVIDTRLYLQQLEGELAARFGDSLPGFVGWESTRGSRFRLGDSGYPFAFAATLLIAFAVGPILGGSLLIAKRQWIALAYGETIDFVGLGYYAHRGMHAIRELTRRYREHSPAMAGGGEGDSDLPSADATLV